VDAGVDFAGLRAAFPGLASGLEGFSTLALAALPAALVVFLAPDLANGVAAFRTFALPALPAALAVFLAADLAVALAVALADPRAALADPRAAFADFRAGFAALWPALAFELWPFPAMLRDELFARLPLVAEVFRVLSVLRPPVALLAFSLPIRVAPCAFQPISLIRLT
jgi:hypothetical protein